MKRTWITLAAVAALAGGTVCFVPNVLADKHPEPSLYPISWELTFEHGKPKRIVVDTGKGPQAFWYITYRVTNLTDAEQQFLPTFEMVSKDGKVSRSDKGIPDGVFTKIKAVEKNDLLEPRAKVVGPLRQGDDQARDSVAIWPETEAEMGEFSIFIVGLSGEFVTLDPDGKPLPRDKKGEAMMTKNPQTGEMEPVILRKTLQLDYVIYGDDKYPDRDEVIDKGEKWVMR